MCASACDPTRRYVENHLQQEVRISILGALLNLGPSQSTRLFRAATRYTPYQFMPLIPVLPLFVRLPGAPILAVSAPTPKMRSITRLDVIDFLVGDGSTHPIPPTSLRLRG